MPEQLKLQHLFDTVSPRERAGAVSSDRMQYQKDWAICKLLKLHLDGLDYLVAFDIHDDVLIFEPENDPTTICFYQIKTTDKDAWTLAQLVRRSHGKKGRLPSILGNLYHNQKLFQVFTKRLTLVSNSPFKIGLSADGKKAEVLPDAETPFSKLPTAKKTEIASAIRLEHALDAEPVLDNLLWFEKADLPLTGHDTFTRGRLSEFFSQVNPTAKYNIPLIYGVLIDEIRRRNDYSKKGISFSEMCKEKAIGKTQFAEIIKIVAVDESPEEAWVEISSRLTAEGMEFSSQQSIRRAWHRVETKRTVVGDAHFRRLAQFVAQLSILESSTLSATMNQGMEVLKPEFGGELMSDDDFLRAVILMKLYNVL